MLRLFFLAIVNMLLAAPAFAQNDVSFAKQDLVYGYKDGLALTMIMLKPARSNGKAVLSLMSGNWVSSHDWEQRYTDRAKPFTDNGYTVFLTLHGSAPRYTIADAVKDIQRAVQYVRFNAQKFGIDSAGIGITGTSSGGHLSLLAATADDAKNPAAKDLVERVSSKVQAAAVFCPPTDFLNWGRKGFNPSTQKALLQLLDVAGAFEFKRWDSARHVYAVIQDNEELLRIAKTVSPVENVTPDDPPTYIMHGDKDLTVPLQQSQEMQQKLQAVNIPVVLTIKPGAGHGWKGMNDDEAEFVKWFDKYLRANQTGGY